MLLWGFPCGEMVKSPPASGLDPWVWKISWRRTQQPTPIFLPGKSHGLAGDSPWVAKSPTWLRDWAHMHARVCACTHTHTHTHTRGSTVWLDHSLLIRSSPPLWATLLWTRFACVCFSFRPSFLARNEGLLARGSGVSVAHQGHGGSGSSPLRETAL